MHHVHVIYNTDQRLMNLTWYDLLWSPKSLDWSLRCRQGLRLDGFRGWLVNGDWLIDRWIWENSVALSTRTDLFELSYIMKQNV